MLDAGGAKIDGDVIIADDVTYKGPLSFFRANVGGKFELRNCGPSWQAILDLRDAKATVLSNDANSWPKPKNLQLRGFVFNELGGRASLDSKTQIEWLRLQSPFVAQPYEQMATVFRNMGYEEAAIKVGIAEKWDEGWYRFRQGFGSIFSTAWEIGRDGILWRYGKVFVHGWEWFQAVIQFLFYDVLWFLFFGWMIQYGYRPWNALFISIAFVVVGTMIFRFAEQKKILKKKESEPARGRRDRWKRVDRNFSAFIYSLETFVPLVKLGVAEFWRIDANVINPVQMGSVVLREPCVLVLWYYWVHIIAGWVFTSLWVAAFTGILKH